MGRFAGRNVVVTGGASGIGEASARRFGAEGGHVVVVDVDAERGECVARGIRDAGGCALFQPCDVSNEDDWHALARRTAEELGPIDVLHSNAFVHLPGSVGDLAVRDWDKQLAVNLTALVLGVRTFLDDLRARRGAVVATSSVHARTGLSGYPAYAAAKGGICALVRQLAVEYGPEVRFNAVLPGAIRTRAWEGAPSHLADEFSARTPLQRLGTSDEVAGAVAFLASSDASYVTGTELVVDGGWSVGGDTRP